MAEDAGYLTPLTPAMFGSLLLALHVGTVTVTRTMSRRRTADR